MGWSHRGVREERRWKTGRSALVPLLAVLALSLAPPGSAAADEYDPRRAGHPVRIAAYVAHPVGVILSELIFRPAHWVGHREPFTTLFGHERVPPDVISPEITPADQPAPKLD